MKPKKPFAELSPESQAVALAVIDAKWKHSKARIERDDYRAGAIELLDAGLAKIKSTKRGLSFGLTQEARDFLQSPRLQ